MKLFVASRKTNGYDEIQNLVIVAESLEAAKLLIAEEASMNNKPKEYTFLEMDMSQAQIVLEDIKYG